MRTFISIVRTFVLALALALLITEFVVVNASVVSGSMEQTIMTGDRVICNRLAYLRREPARFDVVAFNHFEDGQRWVYVKRIVGMPGERLEILDGIVHITGKDAPLPYCFVYGEIRGNYGPFYIPPGHFFVLGDNRVSSYDSKNWPDPFLPRENILGRAVFIYHPRLSLVS